MSRRVITILALALLITMACLLFVSCDKTIKDNGGAIIVENPTESGEDKPIEETKRYILTVNNGKGVKQYTYDEGATITVNADVIDKIFVCWEFEGVEVSKSTSYSFKINNDVTLTAVYADSFLIYLNAKEGATDSGSVTVLYGYDYVLPIPSLEHHYFDGWYYASKAYTDKEGKSIVPFTEESYIILEAKYKEKPIFEIDITNGDADDLINEIIPYHLDTSVTVTAKAVTNRRFVGWFDEDDEIVTADSTYTFEVTAARTLIAKYVEAYRVDVRGGSGSGYYDKGTKITIKLASPPSGQKFVNWKINGVNEIDKTEISFEHTVVDNINFEVVTEKILYKLTYYLDGEIYQEEQEEKVYYYYYNDTIFVPDAPIKEHHTFSGWLNLPTNNRMPANDVIVNGNLTLNRIRLYVTNGNGGGTFGWGSSVTATAVEPEGKKFSRWVTENGVFVSDVSPYTFDLEKESTLVAEFSNIEYTLRFVINVVGEDLHNLLPFGAEEESGEEKSVAGEYASFALVFGQNTSESKSQVPSSLTCQHYKTFSGWSDIPTLMPSRDLIIVGTFVIETHTISVSNATIDEGITTGEFGYNQEITFNASLPIGYEFVEWKLGELVVSSENPYTFRVSRDGAYTAVIKQTQYYLRYYTKANYEEEFVLHHEEPHFYAENISSIPAPSRINHYFGNWSEVPQKMPASDVRVEGVFYLDKHSVTVNGGVITKRNGEPFEPPTASATFEFGDKITVLAQPATGYVFSDWTIAGKVVSTSQEYQFDLESGVVITARFAQKEYTIIYILDGNTEEPYTQQIWFYHDAIATPSDPQKAHHDFSGWFLDIENKSPVPNLMPDVEGQVLTVFGEFVIHTHDIVIQNGFITKKNGEDLPAPVNEGTFDYGTELTIVATLPTGQWFKKWLATDGMEYNIVANPYAGYNGEYPYTLSKDIHITAIFAPARHTVTINSENGKINNEITASSTFDYNTEVTITTQGVKPGQKFLEILKDGISVTTAPTYIFNIVADTVIEVVYEYTQYEVKYVITEGGEYPNFEYSKEYYIYTDVIATLGNPPEVPHYHFSGWSIMGEAVFPTEIRNITKDIRITGSYIIDEHTVTVSGGKIVKAKGVTLPTPVNSGTYSYGTSLTIVADTITGQYFVEWVDDIDTTINTNDTYDFILEENVSYSAVNDYYDYEVQYFISGASYEENTPYIVGEHIYHYNDTINYLEHPSEIESYVFVGWYLFDYTPVPTTMPGVSGKVLKVYGRYDHIYSYLLTTDQMSYSIAKNTNIDADMYPRSVVIPSNYNGKNITEIGDNAFANLPLNTFIVNNNIQKIGANAFSGTSIENITLPFIGKSIDASLLESRFDYIFGSVPTTLSSITITEQLTVSDYAFYNLSMVSSITLPQTITTIGSYAFNNCSNLSVINIPSTVVSIGDYAYDGCSGVQTINYDAINLNDLLLENNVFNLDGQSVDIKIGSMVTALPNYLFCPTPYNIEKASVADKVNIEFLSSGGIFALQSIGDFALSGLNTGVVTLPGTVTTIGDYAFYYSAIDSIIIDNITSIGAYAFASMQNVAITYATNLATEIDANTRIFDSTTGTLIIGNNVSAINDYLFLNSSFSSVSFAATSICTTLGGFAFADNEMLSYLEIPLSITQIGTNAFANAVSLAEIDFNSISLISFLQGTDAFNNCGTDTSLVVNIGSQVTNIPDYLFYSSGNFANITTITVAPNGNCVRVGEYAFSNLENLTTVGFFEFVEVIENNAFENCVNLTSFTISATTITIEESAFNNCTKLTFNCEVFSPLKSWSADWNAGNYPVNYSVNNLTDENYQYVVHNSLVYITRYIGASTAVTVPQTIDTFDVMSIGNAFCNNASLDTVSLPNSIVSIADYAFSNCTSLTALTYSGNITYLGKYAFNNCTSLVTFSIPSGISEINEGVFFNCTSLASTELSQIDLSGIQSIAKKAFYGCETIEYITLPLALTAINELTFAYCINLSNIFIPQSVESIAVDAFVGCSGLQSYVVDENNSFYSSAYGAMFNKDQTEIYHYPIASTQTSYVIPTSVLSVSAYAFYGANNLQTLTIPTSVVYFGEDAFGLCHNLTTIYYNAVAAYTQDDACVFVGAGRDGSGINVIVGDDVVLIAKNLFNDADIFITALTLGNSLEVISENAFLGADSITLTIPSTVITIGNNAFGDNKALTTINYNAINATDLLQDNGVFASAGIDSSGITVNIGSEVTHIPNYLFGRGTTYELNITTLSYGGSSLDSIGSYAFYGANLISITIPTSVTSIGEKAFADNTLVQTLNFNASDITDNLPSDGIFSNLGNAIGEGIFVEVVIGATVKNIPNYFNNGLIKVANVSIGSTVLERVGASAFLGTSITAITLPNSVKYIESRAFENLAFSELTLPNSLLRVGSSAFLGMNSITSLSLPGTLQTIGESAFASWEALTVITIPASVTEIGLSAFGGITNLTTINYNATNVADENTNQIFALSGTEVSPVTVNIGSTVQRIPNYLFSGCEYIYTVIFSGNTVCHSIGAMAFYNLANLATVVDLPATITFIGASAFQGCILLEEISLLATTGKLTIGDYAFRDCDSLVTISFADNSALSEIGNYAFYNCGALQTVSFGTSSVLKSIGSFAFAKCSLLDLIIPPSVANVIVEDQPTLGIGESAFEDCTSLTSVVIPNGVLYILNGTFKNCTSLTTVTMHPNIIYIGDSSFENCTALTGIEIPQKLAYLGTSAYKNCVSVSVLNYNANLAEYSTVSNATNDTFRNLGIDSVTGTALTFAADVKFIPNYLFYGTSESSPNLKSIVFATNVSGMSSVASIGTRAFYYANKAQTLVLPEGLQTIEAEAFGYSSNLEQLTIPSSVTLIKTKAFANATKLTEIAYNAVECEGFENDFINVDKSDVFISAGTYSDYTNEGINLVIGNSVLVLPENMFFSAQSNSKVKTIAFETNGVLAEVGKYSFNGHTSLTTITTMPDTIRVIGERAFYNCTNLVSDMIMRYATSLGNEAFYNCSSLNTLHLAEDLIDLGMSGTYMNCASVTTVNIYTYNLPKISFSSFNTIFKGVGRPLVGGVYGDSDGFVLNISSSVNYLPNHFMHNFESFNLDKEIEEWTLNISEINIGNPNLIIGDYAFSGVGKLTSITLGELGETNTMQIGDYAFYRCPDLETVTLNNVTMGYINEQKVIEESTHIFAFTSITTLDCVNTAVIPVISRYAFYHCENLATINASHTVRAILSGDIYTWIYEDAKIGAIKEYAFANTGLVDVYLSSVTFLIDAHAFENCVSMTTFRWPENVQTIGAYAFYNCTSLSQTTFLHASTSGNYGSPSVTYAELYENGLGTIIGPIQNTLIIGDGGIGARVTMIGEIGENAFYNTYINIDISANNNLYSVDENAFVGMKGTLSGLNNLPEAE